MPYLDGFLGIYILNLHLPRWMKISFFNEKKYNSRQRYLDRDSKDVEIEIIINNTYRYTVASTKNGTLQFSCIGNELLEDSRGRMPPTTKKKHS